MIARELSGNKRAIFGSSGAETRLGGWRALAQGPRLRTPEVARVGLNPISPRDFRTPRNQAELLRRQNKFSHGWTRIYTDEDRASHIRVHLCPSVANNALPRSQVSSTQFPRYREFGVSTRQGCPSGQSLRYIVENPECNGCFVTGLKSAGHGGAGGAACPCRRNSQVPLKSARQGWPTARHEWPKCRGIRKRV